MPSASCPCRGNSGQWVVLSFSALLRDEDKLCQWMPLPRIRDKKNKEYNCKVSVSAWSPGSCAEPTHKEKTRVCSLVSPLQSPVQILQAQQQVEPAPSALPQAPVMSESLETALDFLWFSLSRRPTSCSTTSHSCRKTMISQSLHDLTE